MNKLKMYTGIPIWPTRAPSNDEEGKNDSVREDEEQVSSTLPGYEKGPKLPRGFRVEKGVSEQCPDGGMYFRGGSTRI